MRTRLRKLADSLRSSLWFVPSLMSLAAVALSVGMVALDRAYSADVERSLGIIYSGGAHGARAMLSTIAGSMITVAGVTFSITIVALTLAAQQYGPRLLGNFLRDVGNQVVLGTFIATFLYCLLVLRTIRGDDEQHFIPQLSITVGLLLAMASLGILIYFIHHVSASMQASRIIGNVARDFTAAVDRLFPEEIGDDAPRGVRPEEASAAMVRVTARATGYVQAIDGEELLRAAERRDVVVHLTRRPGDFVVEGSVVAEVRPAARTDPALERAVRDAVLMGGGRTTFQDVGFAIDQLVEVALRALSPGVNDPFTAIACLDQLGAG